MRLLQFPAPDDQRDDLLGVLDDEDLAYTLSQGADEQAGTTLVTTAMPADAVEDVLDDLTEAGLDPDAFTASVDAEFVHFDQADEVQNRWSTTPNRIAPRTLRSKAKDLRLNSRSYVRMMVLSAIVATAGLLLRSPAVVVGSMVIAPIVSPMLTASVGAVRNDRDMLVHSLHLQALGLGLAIATAASTAWLVRTGDVVAGGLAVETMGLISLRISPSMLAVVVGLCAGAAGAFGLATKGQVTIVGVMIAAALIPTAAAAGIGLAWADPVVALGATLLLVLSLVTVNVGATAMLVYLDYRPDEVDDPILSFETAGQALTVTATLGLTLLAVVAVGVLFVQQSGFERDVNRAVGDVLAEEAYDGLGVEALTVEYRTPLSADPPTVTVEIARGQGPDHPALAERLSEAIAERTGHDVRVQVTFVDYQRSPPGN
ncbi:TIGR00341 family protein [Thermoplasmatales archaeon SW_10_69_26]|nr:MAG: TIGR00341 family protein [Thermoplasmatales archaeon SW_10_69_26]